ncbi:pyrroloquinoline quinone-dependent dehydrogenase [Granulicella sp. WH15]|uniref:pyrroloquinoline quinone-dependent dehydrogenase n=1 Tax=Granulicella sp. WH15 TaxID=2602070 RepID=UPI00136791AF|nr:pyrroloquinoline quinone-dependent dehydrogenase [Granulicella sp. WH15]QHN02563.1 pyrroloquinoline quinone-dependent dehydrogenase [Granulicella sp. WH15]
MHLKLEKPAILFGSIIITCLSASGQAVHPSDWPISGGSSDNTHYSPLATINTHNVASLQQAWALETGEKGGLETTPIMVDGILYAYTPTQKVIAINATTGKLLWKFDSGIVGSRPARAVAFWRSSKGSDKRILAGIMNFVYELDATTGKPIDTFGDHGRIDLREDLDRPAAQQSLVITSPAVIYKDLFIVGDATPESLPSPPGDIRAYSVNTGKLRWTFHTIPHPGEFGYDTWPKSAWTYSGSANNWMGMSVDQQRGIVYAPTGSPATDWYGADRIGDNLFADTLLALDAATGKRLWHFQGVHHDLWDRDFPAPPVLFTAHIHGKATPALAQTTKQGNIFVFDRTNGHPLFPIEFRKVEASTVPGEITADTQPFATKPAPFARQLLTENDLTTRTPEAHAWALEHYRNLISKGQFTPIGTGRETVIFPSADGGGEWGGPALDPITNVLYVNSNEFVHTESLSKQEASGGRSIYLSQCAACHGQSLTGAPPAIPSLINIQEKLTPEQIVDLLQKGRGRMPSFPAITGDRRKDLISYLINGEPKETKPSGPISYSSNGYHRFYDPEGYPANSFPWGTLNAINLNTGEYLWKIPFGEYPELVAKGIKDTGSENYGGPLVTRGGLLVIGATIFDNKLRIFDKATGKLLWEKVLPFAVNATPMTYAINGKQYIVVACGGEGRNPHAPTGGIYYAFSLPDAPEPH